MADINLPTEADVRALDVDTFVWDDLMDGMITEVQGSVIKTVVEQLPAGDTVMISEDMAGTGKTAKFILDNCSNGANVNIVTTDVFSDVYLTTSEYFENVENAPNVYKNDLSGVTRTNFNEGGDAISVDTLDAFGDDPTVILSTRDLLNSPVVMGVNDLASYQKMIPASHPVNHAGTSLADSGYLGFDACVMFPWPVSRGFPEHELEATKTVMASMFNNLRSGGAMIIFQFHLPMVNVAFWEVFNAMTNTGRFWSAEWVLNSEPDNTGHWQGAIIKKA